MYRKNILNHVLCNVWISGKVNIYKKGKTSFQTTKPERVNKENKSGNEKQQTQNVNKQIQYRQTNKAKIPNRFYLFISTDSN